VDCAYWTDRTAISPYLQKGKQVFVEGTPEVRTFTRQDGTSGASLSLRVREVQLLGGKADSGGSSSYSDNARPEAAPVSGGDSVDDLPF